MPKNPPQASIRWGRVFAWSGSLVLLELLAIWLLRRLMDGKLFLFALPGDAPASSAELSDAAASAKAYFWPALVVIAVIWGLVAICSERVSMKSSREWFYPNRNWLLDLCLGLFVVGTLADIVTTFGFFHRDGIDQELHPGIRLVSFSLGRSVGPIVTKAIQFAGVLLICLRWPKVATSLLAGAGIMYLLGACYNLWISFQ